MEVPLKHPLLLAQLSDLQMAASKVPTKRQWSALLNTIAETYKSVDLERDQLNQNLEVAQAQLAAKATEASHKSFHDPLTGLPNRALFLDRIDIAIEKAGRKSLGTAVLFLDLDNFKVINDSLGHSAGDHLLTYTTAKFLEAVRPGDTVARFGGDEFTILLEDLDSIEEAEAVAKKIIAELQTPVDIEGTEVFTAVSIGIAFTRWFNIEAAELIKSADIAMYHAKRNGRNCYEIFSEKMNERAFERLEIETHLRKAIERDELYTLYQPLIDMVSGTTIGAEALCRWNNPYLGEVPPSRFIPIAEENGLIIPIGYWVMESACKQMRQWIDEFGLTDFRMSINLSGKQLQKNDVVTQVADILARTNVPAENIKLEITESVFASEKDSVVDKLSQLKELGLELALDDFGTGYSSLSILSMFPIDTIKIDKSFIDRLEHEPETRSVVQAILELSRSMRMTVTSEGIETDFQRNFVNHHGCKYGQGYLFSQPLAQDEFDVWLRLSGCNDLSDTQKAA